MCGNPHQNYPSPGDFHLPAMLTETPEIFQSWVTFAAQILARADSYTSEAVSVLYSSVSPVFVVAVCLEISVL